MGRACIQRLDSSAWPWDESSGTPPPNDELAVWWVESVLEFPSQTPQEQADLACIACVFLDLTRDRFVAADLGRAARSLRGVRVQREQFGGVSAIEAFAESAKAREIDFLHIVLLLGSGEPAAQLADSALEVLHALHTDSTGVLLVVGPAGTAHKNVCTTRDGFIVVDSAEPSTGAQLLLALTTLLAPRLLTCLDSEDLLDGLSGSSGPARVVLANWHPLSKELMFASVQGRADYASCASAVAFLFQGGGASALPDAIGALRHAAPDCENFNYQVALDHVEVKHADVTSVVLLCRP